MYTSTSKDSPADVRDELPRSALYAETSVRQGLPLASSLPASFNELTVAASKAVLCPHGWWETVPNHFVTYTRNPTLMPVSRIVDQGSLGPVRSVAEDATTQSPLYDSINTDKRPEHD